MEDTPNRCQIKRAGNVLRISETQAVIIINGRQIPVPIEKLGHCIEVGDEVKWTGTLWDKVPSSS